MNISDDVKGVLAAASTIGPAIVAGGYLRDLKHDVEFNDIDVFIECPDGISRSQVEKVFGRVTKKECAYGEFRKDYISSVYSFKKFDLILINVKLAAVLDDFDFGINQIWYDGYKVHMTRDFISSYLVKDMYPLPGKETDGRVDDRGHRIARKLGYKYKGNELTRRFTPVAIAEPGFFRGHFEAMIAQPGDIVAVPNGVRGVHRIQNEAIAVNPARGINAAYVNQRNYMEQANNANAAMAQNYANLEARAWGQAMLRNIANVPQPPPEAPVDPMEAARQRVREQVRERNEQQFMQDARYYAGRLW